MVLLGFEMMTDSLGEERGPIKITAKPSLGTQLNAKNSTDIVFPGRSSSQRHRKLINTCCRSNLAIQRPDAQKTVKANENSKARCFCAAGRFSSFHSLFKEF